MKFSPALCFLSLGTLVGLRLSRNNNTRQARFFGICLFLSALAWIWPTTRRTADSPQSLPDENEPPSTASRVIDAISQGQKKFPSPENASPHIPVEQVEAILAKLPLREREIIRMRYAMDDGVAHTLGEVGERFGLSREQVRDIEMRALRKLRRIGRNDGHV